MPNDQSVVVPGLPSPTIRDVLQHDSRPIDPILLSDRNDYLGDVEQVVDTGRFLSREFQRLENERMWSRVWQIACREEQIPEEGDYVLYEVAGNSLIIVRSGAAEFRAYYNACLHRGRTLCERDGHVRNFRCKFHGWVYSLDGKLAPPPSSWDFRHVKLEEYRLPQARVGRWGGFVFINMDTNAIPLEEYIRDIPEVFARWRFEDRFLAAHVGQVVRANWKVAMEAFLENYHVMATHTQVLSYVADASAQYTARKDRPHYSRNIFAVGIPSPHVAAQTTPEKVRKGLNVMPSGQPLGIPWPLPEGKSLRECAADAVRANLTAITGDDRFAQLADTEALDGWVYTLFPNFVLFGGYSTNLCFRFRPWTDDPEMSLMEAMVLLPSPKHGVRPPAAKMTLLGAEQNFADAPELGPGSAFLNQDLFNMAWVQKGMRSLQRRQVTLAKYQESQIRHFHRTLDMYVRGDGPPR